MKNKQKPSYGYIKRAENRKQKALNISQQSKNICEYELLTFLEEHKDGYTDDQIYALYDKIFTKLSARFANKQLVLALKARTSFFYHLNVSRQKNGLSPLPAPATVYEPKRPANTNDLETFLYHQTANTVINNTIDRWIKKDNFNIRDTICYLLFSLVSFAGYNEAELLEPIYQAICHETLLEFNGHYGLVINIPSKMYGNQINNQESEVNSSATVITYSRFIVLDDVSLMWYTYLQRLLHESEGRISDISTTRKFPTFKSCINKLLDITNLRTFKKTPILEDLSGWEYLSHVNIYWQTLDNVRIDNCLVQTRIGKQRHTTLTKAHWQLYFNPILPKFFTIQDSDLTNLLIKPRISKSRPVIPRYDVVNMIRKNLKEKSSIKSSLTELSKEVPPNGQRLIAWMLQLLGENNTVSTLKRYLSEVGNDFMWATRDAEFDMWQAQDYEYAYQLILTQKFERKSKTRASKVGYTQQVLLSLHATLKKYFNAPNIHLLKRNDPMIVRSRMIAPEVYHRLLAIIDEQKGTLNDQNKLLLKVIISLLYRTGMRINEVLGLKLSDFEYDSLSLNDFSVIVRSNEHRQIKSDDGTRRLCLSILLTEKEKAWLRKLFLMKYSQRSRYLFTLANHSLPIDYHGVEQVLRQVKYGEEAITAHSFRHHSISMMAMILRCDASFVGMFSDYSADQIKLIKTHFLGPARNISPNYWHALMSFAGHADLNTTFNSYIHTADLIASHQLSSADINMPIGLVMKLTGLRRENLNRGSPNAANFKDNTVNLRRLRRKLSNKLNAIPITKKTHRQKQDDNPVPNTIDGQLVKNKDLFTKYSREAIYDLLAQLEEGKSLVESCGSSFDYDDACAIYTSALTLAIDEGKPHHKLIGKDRISKSDHPLIAPTPLHFQSDIALSHLCFENMDKLWQDKGGRKELLWFLETFYNKVSGSKSAIRFPFKDRKTVYRYLDIAQKIIPEKYWRININLNSVAEGVNAKEIKQFIAKETEGFRTRFPNTLVLNKHTDYSGYTLSIIRPTHKDKVNPQQKSSVLMKFLGHWGLILTSLADKITQ
ncbi:tyrosine-type recombinase/integrase [Moraxella bovoculi]|uniref:tyrosine-type recombinase/integrase n=1 Tax=Moraxella bovoculi TaxID=386891 RepID=UPI003F4FA6DE